MIHCLLLSLTLCQMIHDKPVSAMMAAHSITASYDYIQTRQDLNEGRLEANPLGRPFVHSTPLLMAAGAVEVLGVSYVVEKMKHSDHAFLRKTWFIPQAVAISAHISCAIYSRTNR